MPSTTISSREHVRELLALGFSQQEIAEVLGLSKSTVAYHARRAGRPPDERFNRRYDWPEVQRFYDEGRTVRECIAHFGFSAETWHSAVRRGAVVPRPRLRSIEDLLASGRSRVHLKVRLVAAGLLEDRCGACGISEWRGAPLTLELHHINGVGTDNRLENVQLLCPNCHRQTDSWGGRNRRG